MVHDEKAVLGGVTGKKSEMDGERCGECMLA